MYVPSSAVVVSSNPDAILIWNVRFMNLSGTELLLVDKHLDESLLLCMTIVNVSISIVQMKGFLRRI